MSNLKKEPDIFTILKTDYFEVSCTLPGTRTRTQQGRGPGRWRSITVRPQGAPGPLTAGPQAAAPPKGAHRNL